MTATNATTNAILSLLTYSGHYVWRNNTVGIYDPVKKTFRKSSAKRGVSDIIGIHRDSGKMIAVEVKTGKDKLSQYQIDFLEEVKKRGGITVVARTVEDVMNCDELK